MRTRALWAGAVIVALAMAVAAQAQWTEEGWNLDYMKFGRTEGPVTVDIWQLVYGMKVEVAVSGCGGVRDYRTFGSEVDDGDGQAREIAAALNRLLAEARRTCGFEEALAARIEQGLEPAYLAFQEELAQGNNMSTMDMNLAVECSGEECNGM